MKCESSDYQSGWDTDQFPNNVPEVALTYYEILKGGGFTTGGTNFDAKLRRQSLDPVDLVACHVGAMDVCARGLKAAAAMLEDGELESMRKDRYARWDTDGARARFGAPGKAGEPCEPLCLVLDIVPEQGVETGVHAGEADGH